MTEKEHGGFRDFRARFVTELGRASPWVRLLLPTATKSAHRPALIPVANHSLNQGNFETDRVAHASNRDLGPAMVEGRNIIDRSDHADP